MTEINATSDGQSKQIIIGENKGVVNAGDTYEVQREVLALGIERWRPQLDPEEWVDRGQPQAELQRRIADPTEPLVEVVAAGGFGKSLLAAWAYDQSSPHFAKSLWLNCRNQPSFNGVSRYILQEMGWLIRDDATPDDLLVNELAARLTEKPTLVVIDQLEAIRQRQDWPAFAAFLSLWQRRGTGSMVVLTTREPVLSEARYRLDLGGFTATEGATYLNRQQIAAEPSTLEALSILGQGHPLLLKFAASWLQETAAGRLEASGLSFFEGLFQQGREDTALAAQLTTAESQVEQIFKALLARLMPQRRELLLAVSVYRQPFTLTQAQAMDDQITTPDLVALVDCGLLMAQGERWTLHPLVQTLVQAELEAVGQGTAAHQRAVAYFSGQLAGDRVELSDVLECFYHHMQLQDYGAAYEVMAPATNWLDRQGYYQRLVSVYGQLVTAWQAAAPTTTEDQRRWANSLNNLGNAYQSLGEYHRAISLHEQSLEIMRAIGDRGGEAASLGNLGNAYFSLGEYRRAISLHEQSLAIEREIGDRRGEATSLSGLGNVYFSLGEYHQASSLHKQSLEIMREIGDRGGEAASLGNLGLAYFSLGEYRRAISFHEQSLAIEREIGDRGGEAASLSGLGLAYASLGEYRRAISLHEQSLAIDREIGDRRGEATSLSGLGLAYFSLGEYRQAISFYEQSLEIKRKIGDRRGEANSLGNLGLAYASLGEYRQAISFYEQSLAIQREIGDRFGEAASLFNRATALAKIDDYWAGRQGLEQARALFVELQLNHRIEQCDALIREYGRIIGHLEQKIHLR
jgi:tetratricopeptide (TPR) repeat protein